MKNSRCTWIGSSMNKQGLLDLSISQNSPSHSPMQEHTRPDSEVTQLPPFWHGMSRQFTVKTSKSNFMMTSEGPIMFQDEKWRTMRERRKGMWGGGGRGWYRIQISELKVDKGNHWLHPWIGIRSGLIVHGLQVVCGLVLKGLLDLLLYFRSKEENI